MRTTVRLDDALMQRARREASKRGTTLTALIEQGLRMVLRAPADAARRPRVVLPVSPERGGTQPGVDLDDTSSLIDRMEGRS
ncbi:MAG TPA: DUF2191 domain-containing protein [Casimicrobiaceae bacterium]|nr:DUF2191 domain-containing protein [Casimicrobiaceae bacterium]